MILATLGASNYGDNYGDNFMKKTFLLFLLILPIFIFVFLVKTQGLVKTTYAANCTCQYSDLASYSGHSECTSGYAAYTGVPGTNGSCVYDSSCSSFDHCVVSSGTSPPAPSPSSPTSSGSGGTNPNGIVCKEKVEPSEVGINNSSVCDRLHDYRLVKPNSAGTAQGKGISTTCAAENHTCKTNADCPQNTSDRDKIVASTSNWCYGFRDGARCLQLQFTGQQINNAGCAPGEANGGPNGCPNLDSCSKCVLTTRDDILPHYASWGWDTQCSNMPNIVTDWCRIDPNGCRSLKSGTCSSQCSNVPAASPSPSPGTASPSPSSSPGTGCNANYTFTPGSPAAGRTFTLSTNVTDTPNNACVVFYVDNNPIATSQCQVVNSGGSAGHFQASYACTGANSGSSGQHTVQAKFGQSSAYPGVTACGSAVTCNTGTYTVSGASPSASPSASSSSPTTTTVSFRVAENPADFTETGPNGWQSYTAEPMLRDYEFKDKTPGPKSVFVEFKSSDGRIDRKTAQIRLLGPDPVIASCSLSFEGNNTILNLVADKDKGFGKDKGEIKSGDTPLQIREWKNGSVKAVWQNAPEGQVMPVILTNTDGQTGEGQCSAISQLSVGAKFFCRTVTNHDVDNVDLSLAGAFAGGAKIKQKIKIGADGVIQGLTQKLEEGKDYKLSLKAPRSLRKTVPFTAGSGTTNIPNFVLPVGDIFPPDGGDGKINSVDKGELNRQWIISKDATGRSGDFNQDGRVNSIDWACMVPDFNREDDPEPAVGATPTPSSSLSPSPTASASPSPSPSSSPSPSAT